MPWSSILPGQGILTSPRNCHRPLCLYKVSCSQYACCAFTGCYKHTHTHTTHTHTYTHTQHTYIHTQHTHTHIHTHNTHTYTCMHIPGTTNRVNYNITKQLITITQATIITLTLGIKLYNSSSCYCCWILWQLCCAPR